MQSVNKSLILFKLSILILYSCSVVSAKENLALHKSYTYEPEPNYSYCTDSMDSVQLTDGRKLGSQWTNKTTVGWRKAEPVVEIVVDLQKVCAIEQVRIHTIGGGFADVDFPEYVVVLLSDDGKEFRYASMVSSRQLDGVRSKTKGMSRILTVTDINAAGRYVKLAVRPTVLNFFADEIEILGEPLLAMTGRRNMQSLETFDGYPKLLTVIEEQLQLQDDITAVQKTLTRVNIISDVTVSAEFANLAEQSRLLDSRLFDAGEIDQMKEQLGRVKAQIYSQYYKKSIMLLPANPMDVVYEKEMLLSDNPRQIDIQMWQNEYESATFNIINCSENTLSINISVSPLLSPEGQKIDSDKTFTLRRAVYTKTSQAGSIADALVLQQERPFDIVPGQLIQLWLTVYNPALEAGIYKGAIAVLAESADDRQLPVETIPLTLTVGKEWFPQTSALQSCNWAYYDAASDSAMVKDLQSHYTSVYVVPAQDLPFLRFSSDKPGVIRTPDYTKLDKVLIEHSYARVFMLGLNFSPSAKDYGRFGSAEWMSTQWKETFCNWLKELVEHLKVRGIGYERFVLYPYDESICDDYYELAKLIKSIDANIQLYANSFGKGPEEFLRFRELIDIWCLQDSHCEKYPAWYTMIKSFDREMWTYECLRPTRAKEPYSYYRLLPWKAFKRGQTGAGFWIYYYGTGFETGAVPWDDTLRPYGFSSVVYGAKAAPENTYEDIVPSRRWEAWREGIEDYQFLFEVQNAINKIRVSEPAWAEQYQRELDRQVDTVLNNPSDSSVVYKARKVLSYLLSEINKQ